MFAMLDNFLTEKFGSGLTYMHSIWFVHNDDDNNPLIWLKLIAGAAETLINRRDIVLKTGESFLVFCRTKSICIYKMELLIARYPILGDNENRPYSTSYIPYDRLNIKRMYRRVLAEYYFSRIIDENYNYITDIDKQIEYLEKKLRKVTNNGFSEIKKVEYLNI